MPSFSHMPIDACFSQNLFCHKMWVCMDCLNGMQGRKNLGRISVCLLPWELSPVWVEDWLCCRKFFTLVIIYMTIFLLLVDQDYFCWRASGLKFSLQSPASIFSFSIPAIISLTAYWVSTVFLKTDHLPPVYCRSTGEKKQKVPPYPYLPGSPFPS